MNMHAANGLYKHGISNVGSLTAGPAWHNSSNVGSVTAGQVWHNYSENNGTVRWKISARKQRNMFIQE